MLGRDSVWMLRGYHGKNLILFFFIYMYRWRLLYLLLVLWCLLVAVTVAILEQGRPASVACPASGWTGRTWHAARHPRWDTTALEHSRGGIEAKRGSTLQPRMPLTRAVSSITPFCCGDWGDLSEGRGKGCSRCSTDVCGSVV